MLADVSAPTALPKAPARPLVSLRRMVNPSEEDEPNLQISVGETRCEFPPLTR